MPTSNIGLTEVEQSSAQKVVVINQAFEDIDNAGNAVSDFDASTGGNITVTTGEYNRAVVMRLSGTVATGTAFDLELPSNARLFGVDNSTDQEVNVFVGGAVGSSVAVPSGSQFILHSDGTDVKSFGGGGGGGGGGSPLSVSDGTTTVPDVTTMTFTNATVTSPSAGTADIAVSTGGGGGSTANRDFSRVGLTASEGIPNNVLTPVAWDAAEENGLAAWDPAQPTRLTVPTGVSQVQLNGGFDWAPSGSGTNRVIILSKNGTEQITAVSAGVNGSSVTNLSSGPLNVVPGDYFELEALQNAGATLNLDPVPATFFSMVNDVGGSGGSGGGGGGSTSWFRSRLTPGGRSSNTTVPLQGFDPGSDPAFTISGNHVVIPAGVSAMEFNANVEAVDSSGSSFFLRIELLPGGSEVDREVIAQERHVGSHGGFRFVSSIGSGPIQVAPGDEVRVQVQHNANNLNIQDLPNSSFSGKVVA